MNVAVLRVDRYIGRYLIGLFWPGLTALFADAKRPFIIFAIYKFLPCILYIIICRLCNIWHINELLMDKMIDPNMPEFGHAALLGRPELMG